MIDFNQILQEFTLILKLDASLNYLLYIYIYIYIYIRQNLAINLVLA